MRIIALLGIFFLGSLASGCASLSESSGFETPESVAVDTETGARYISNVNGDPYEKDSNGYISKIVPNGSTTIQKFIAPTSGEGVLHAPKGLCVTANKIFVTDVDCVKIYDKESGKWLKTVDLRDLGAKFVNDLAMNSAGILYASDQLADKIYSIDTAHFDVPSVFLESPVLGNPNGLIVNPRTGHLIVVTWTSGAILEIEPRGRIHRLKKGLTSLDGVDYDVEGNLYVSSFDKGEVYKIPFYGRGTITTFLSSIVTPADLCVDRQKHELLVPSFNGNTMTAYPLFQKKGKGGEGQQGAVKDPSPRAD